MREHPECTPPLRLRTIRLGLLMGLGLALICSISAVFGAAPGDPAPAADTAETDAAPEPPEAGSSPVEQTMIRETIDVVEDRPPNPAIVMLSHDELPSMPLGDGADLLRGLAGVSIGRMGGHGLEPNIRGLGESNLNILVDGAYIHGGCPNRMDPPTSFAATGGFDSVTVVKGFQSLQYGAGGSGGTVIFERQAPPVAAQEPWGVQLETGYTSWSANPEVTAHGVYSGDSFYLRADGETRQLDSYEDGSGEVVRSAYETRTGNLILGLGNREQAFFELGYEQGRTEDALFAGAGMDSPYDRNDTYRLKFDRVAPIGAWVGFQADLYLSQVEHLMDNYSLRDRIAPMALRVPATSDTFGGRASAELQPGPLVQLTLGLDYQENQREALRFAGPTEEQVSMLQSVMWPDATLSQGGLFVEGDRLFERGARLRFGARLDSFEASAAKTDLRPFGMNLAPDQLYELYYGAVAEDWGRTGVSALLRFELPVGAAQTLFAGLSRSHRAPDATERYLGAGSPIAAMRWVGNPELDVSTHHQIDLGIFAVSPRVGWSATAFLDEVDDFILRDRAHGQAGILLSDNASIYRNVEARLVGLEVDGSWQASTLFSLRGNASWVHGDNRTDGRPLAQIPPLQGLIAAGFASGPWRSAVDLSWALEQTRVDDDPLTGSGLDAGPTPGFAILGLEGGYVMPNGFELMLGVDNLFNDTYAEHLNRGNLFDPDPVRVNEPGRTAWVRLRWLGGQSRPTGP